MTVSFGLAPWSPCFDEASMKAIPLPHGRVPSVPGHTQEADRFLRKAPPGTLSRRLNVLVAGVLLLGGACRRVGALPLGPDGSAALGPAVQAAQAREILLLHCGRCHIPHLPTSNPRALRVYDLTEADWSRRMSDPQLQKSVTMLSQRKTLTRAELAELLPPGAPMIVPTSAEERAYDEFVAAELLRRRGAPMSR